MLEKVALPCSRHCQLHLCLQNCTLMCICKQRFQSFESWQMQPCPARAIVHIGFCDVMLSAHAACR